MSAEDDSPFRSSANKGKSVEQIAEQWARDIRMKRSKILKDFHKAYVAQLSDKESLDLESICLVEQQDIQGLVTKWWFEYKPVI